MKSTMNQQEAKFWTTVPAQEKMEARKMHGKGYRYMVQFDNDWHKTHYFKTANEVGPFMREEYPDSRNTGVANLDHVLGAIDTGVWKKSTSFARDGLASVNETGLITVQFTDGRKDEELNIRFRDRVTLIAELIGKTSATALIDDERIQQFARMIVAANKDSE
jgi:hypothetical protein